MHKHACGARSAPRSKPTWQRGGSPAEAWEDVSLSYDDLMALPYLDALLRETLRVYPPSSVHFRV